MIHCGCMTELIIKSIRSSCMLILVLLQWGCSAKSQSGTLDLLGSNSLYVDQSVVYSTAHSGGGSSCSSWSEEADNTESSSSAWTFEVTQKPEGSSATTTKLSDANPKYYAFTPDRAGNYVVTFTYGESISCDDGSDDSTSTSLSMDVTVQDPLSNLLSPTTDATYATAEEFESAYPDFPGLTAVTKLHGFSESPETSTFENVVLSQDSEPVAVSFTVSGFNVDYDDYEYGADSLDIENGYDTMTIGDAVYDLNSPYANNSSWVYVGDADGDSIDEIIVYSVTFEANAEEFYRYRKISP